MPNREELACLICGKDCAKYPDCPFDGDTPSCKKAGNSADRVIEAGYTKNNLQATIDGIPAGEFYAKQVQKAVEAERKEIANSIENYLNISPKELPRLVKELRGE
jgi:hypothetical protein